MKFPRIIIETIPHGTQDYPTCGNYKWDEDGALHLYISAMGDWRSELAVAIHELVEVFMCLDKGIAFADIDAFDIQFEKQRAEGLHAAHDEPGDDTRAPYFVQHIIATEVERTVTRLLSLDWESHEENVRKLDE